MINEDDILKMGSAVDHFEVSLELEVKVFLKDLRPRLVSKMEVSFDPNVADGMLLLW